MEIKSRQPEELNRKSRRGEGNEQVSKKLSKEKKKIGKGGEGNKPQPLVGGGG